MAELIPSEAGVEGSILHWLNNISCDTHGLDAKHTEWVENNSTKLISPPKICDRNV
jgi:hypothetical protein